MLKQENILRAGHSYGDTTAEKRQTGAALHDTVTFGILFRCISAMSALLAQVTSIRNAIWWDDYMGICMDVLSDLGTKQKERSDVWIYITVRNVYRWFRSLDKKIPDYSSAMIIWRCFFSSADNRSFTSRRLVLETCGVTFNYGNQETKM